MGAITFHSGGYVTVLTAETLVGYALTRKPPTWYNGGMSDSLALLNEELRLKRTLAVIEHHVTTGDPITVSCDTCNVPTSTFYKWIADGVLDTYLEDARKSRSDTAAAMAAEAIPDITAYLVRVATGKIRVRGANPIAAAQLILTIAGVRPDKDKSAADLPVTVPANVLQFMPQLGQFNIVQGMPAQDEEGRFEVIDGTAEELPPSGENPPTPAE
jgi:hypothetical protein